MEGMMPILCSDHNYNLMIDILADMVISHQNSTTVLIRWWTNIQEMMDLEDETFLERELTSEFLGTTEFKLVA